MENEKWDNKKEEEEKLFGNSTITFSDNYTKKYFNYQQLKTERNCREMQKAFFG